MDDDQKVSTVAYPLEEITLNYFPGFTFVTLRFEVSPYSHAEYFLRQSQS